MDWLIFTLKALLPNSYPKNTNNEVIESTINYLKELEERLSEHQEKYPTNVEVKLEQSNVINSFSGIETESAIENILIDLENFCDEDSQNEFGFDMGHETVENIVIQKSFWTDENTAHSSKNIIEEEENVDEKQKVEEKSKVEEKGEEEQKIKRPWNGFIRFSKTKRKEVIEKYPTFDNRKISVILGCMWRKLPEDDKKIFVDEFNLAMQERREKYPDWNYAASRAKKHCKQEPNVILTNRLRPRTKDRKTKIVTAQSAKRVPKTKKVSETTRMKSEQKIETDFWVQCDLCGQWRKLLANDTEKEKLPDIWNCSMNPDPFYNQCIIKEELN